MTQSTPTLTKPSGTMILRTLAMPADTNANGDIFGGWIMSQMDIAGGILAKWLAKGRTVTVAVDGMKFIRPVKVGDVVSVHGHVVNIGTTSIRLGLEVWVEPVLRGSGEGEFMVTEACFTYVAIDEQGNKRPLPQHIESGEY